MDNKIRHLKYHLPQLGRVNIFLYSNAAKTYEVLEKYDLIERMSRIHQLGVVRHIYEGAHHTRLDYVMLQLYLINNIKNCKNDVTGKEISKGLGLNRSIKIDGKKPSGIEILQIWSLLFNAGHLPGTFASESALLKAMKSNNNLKRTFCKGLPNKKMKERFKELLDNEDIYDLHKFIINFLLERFKRKYKDFVNFLHNVLEIYMYNSDSYISIKRISTKDSNVPDIYYNLIKIYKRIRQISYLYLDSYYCPVPVYLNLPSIFTNLPEYIKILFREQKGSIIETLDTFENFLSTYVYYSEDSMKELGAHSNRVGKVIDKNINKEDVTKITGLNKLLVEKSNIFVPKNIEFGDPYIFHLLIKGKRFYLGRIFEELYSKLSYDIEQKWNYEYGLNACVLTIHKSLINRILVINLVLNHKNDTKKNVNIIGKFLKDLVNLKMDIIDVRRGIHSIMYHRNNLFFDNVFQKFVIEVLKYITKEDLNFEFKEDYFPGSVLAIRGSKNGAKFIRNLFKERHISKRIEDRREHEFNKLIESLNNINHKTSLLICLSSILVYDERREHLTDLDGLALGYSKGNLKILLVEAKDQKKGGIGDSKKQLNKTLKKLNFLTSEKHEIKNLSKGAYSFFNINGEII